MAKNKADQGSGSSSWSEKRSNELKEQNEQAELTSDWESNIEVNDFLADLAVSLRYRDKVGVERGDWIEEPGRAFSDGKIFGEEVQTSAEGKLQITVTLDGSRSMWNLNLMRFAGPAFQALDQMIRKAAQDLPPGVVTYAPFLFHETAYKLPESFRHYFFSMVSKHKRYGQEITTRFMCPENATSADIREAVRMGELPPSQNYEKDYKLFAKDTLAAPLFKAIQAWEQANDPNATRLDIVITDGHFEDEDDIAAASRIQDERNGKLTTVLLNFLPVVQWHKAKLPERCIQYPVTLENLNNSIRKIVEETVSSML